MDITVLDLKYDSVIKHIEQNLVESGVLTPYEVAEYEHELHRLSFKDLIAVLLESLNLRVAAVNPINYYPIDMENISSN